MILFLNADLDILMIKTQLMKTKLYVNDYCIRIRSCNYYVTIRLGSRIT